MSSAKRSRDPFVPVPPKGRGLAFALAALAHVLLIVAIAFGVHWRSSQPTPVSAELWSVVPQAAAPRAVEPAAAEPKPVEPKPVEPEPVEAPPPPPPAAPPPPPMPPQYAPLARPAEPVEPPAPAPPPPPDPQIAIEQAKREEAQRLLAEREQQEQIKREKALREAATRERERAKEALAQKQAEREKAEQQKAEREKAEREKAERVAAEREKAAREAAEREKARAKEALAKKKAAEEKAAEEKAAAEKARKAEAALAAARERNLERLQGMAGATGGATDTGSAARSSGPSAGYAGRIMARVKPNIVFTDTVSGNPKAVVEVRLAPDGTIVSKRLVQSSGDKGWDDAVLRAIERTGELPRDTDGRVPPQIEIGFRPRD